MVGGILLGSLGVGVSTYAWLFVASSVARLAILPLLGRAAGARLAPAKAPEDISLRTLAVRPAAGAVQRPIFASLERGREPRLRRADAGSSRDSTPIPPP